MVVTRDHGRFCCVNVDTSVEAEVVGSRTGCLLVDSDDTTAAAAARVKPGILIGRVATKGLQQHSLFYSRLLRHSARKLGYSVFCKTRSAENLYRKRKNSDDDDYEECGTCYDDRYSCWPPPVCVLLMSFIEVIDWH
jgi:hypothetical protein